MEHHIDQLMIYSLRRLQDLRLPQLGRFNLLVGENNSGKTTALEAIALFCRPLGPLDWLEVARRRAIRSSRESGSEGPTGVRPAFTTLPSTRVSAGVTRNPAQHRHGRADRLLGD